MNVLEQYLNTSEEKDYYKKQIELLSKKQLKTLATKVAVYVQHGAKQPLKWAFNDVKENKNSLNEFLLLAGLFHIIDGIEDNILDIDDANDGDGAEKELQEITSKVNKEVLNSFLRKYTKTIIWQVANLLDDPGAMSFDANWGIAEFNENNEFVQTIGLHENILFVEEEIQSLDKKKNKN